MRKNKFMLAMLGIAFSSSCAMLYAEDNMDILKAIFDARFLDADQTNGTLEETQDVIPDVPLVRNPFVVEGNTYIPQSEASGSRESVTEIFIPSGSKYVTGYYPYGSRYYGYPYGTYVKGYTKYEEKEPPYPYSPPYSPYPDPNKFDGKEMVASVAAGMNAGLNSTAFVILAKQSPAIRQNAGNAMPQIAVAKNKSAPLFDRKALKLANADKEKIFRDLDQLGVTEAKTSSVSVWMNPFYQHQNDKSAVASKSWDAGSLFGVKYKNNPNSFSLGLILGFTFGKVKASSSNLDDKTNGFLGGLEAAYGPWDNGNIEFLYLRSSTKIKSSRTISGQIARADKKKTSDIIDLRLNHYFTRENNKWVFGGIVGHSWTFDKLDAFKEVGASTLSASKVNGRSSDVFLGARVLFNGLSKAEDALKLQLKGEYMMLYKYSAKDASYKVTNLQLQTATQNYKQTKGLAHKFEASVSAVKNSTVFGLGANFMFAKKYTGYGIKLFAKHSF